MGVKWICTGGCGGEVTDEEYKAGKTTCGSDTCARHGQPFEKRMVCDDCGAVFKEGEEHSC